MKIAFIVPLFPKLSETFILSQITGLLDRGHDVDIFAKRPGEELVIHPDVEKYKLLDRTHYMEIPSNKFLRSLKGLGLIVTNFPKSPKTILKSLNIFKYGKTALSLNLLYTTVPFLNYDIIHCHFGTIGNWAVTLKKLGIKAKLVVTFHGYDTRLGIEKGGDIYHNLFKEGDCFIAISAYNYKSLINFGLDQRKIIYHPVGIDINQFSFRYQSESSRDNMCIKVITVARLVKEKGLQYGIRAVYKLLQQNPRLNLKYNIIGEGPLREDLTGLIRELKLSKVVHLLGPQGQKHVIKMLQESHIFLLPSIAEALPVVLMESQAVGLPVIATAVGSVDQIVLNKKSGFIVPPRDVDALADKLKYLIEHPERWSEMGRIGRKYVEENFDINKLNNQLVKIYQQLLN